MPRPTPSPDAAPAMTRAYLSVTVVYLIATAAAVGSGYLARSAHPLAIIAIADVAGTIAVFAGSVILDNSSCYDPYWSVAPPIVGVYLVAQSTGADPARQVLVVALISAWGVRLTYNWLRGWRGLGHEDWRYVDFRRKTGRAYWLVSFSGIHLFPTVMVFAGLIPVYYAVGRSGPGFGPLDGVAAAITAAAIAIETIADAQLHRFRRDPANAGRTLRRGLWAISRYPNYIGEVLFWWGLALFGLAAGAPAWTLAGAAAMTLMFVFVSVPLKRDRMGGRPAPG